MAGSGAYTLAEITSQPTVWRDALDKSCTLADSLRKLWTDDRFDRVIITGCGSTYYLSVFGATLFQSLLGVSTHALPASELVLFPDLVLIPNKRTLLVAVSRSGETTETIEAVRLAHSQTGGPVVAVTCSGESALAREADITLAVDAAQEQSVAQTRSFSSMTILATAVASILAQRDDFTRLETLIPVGKRLLSEYSDLARQLGEANHIDRFFFLGSGLQYGIACEAMLKLKEMSLSYSEAFHTLEFRHGPMSMVNAQTLVIGLLSEQAFQQEAAVLEQMRNYGARILALCETDNASDIENWSQVVRLQSGLPAWMRPVLYLPVLQLMAYYRAIARGLNPDQPANLQAVVSLSGLHL